MTIIMLGIFGGKVKLSIKKMYLLFFTLVPNNNILLFFTLVANNEYMSDTCIEKH